MFRFTPGITAIVLACAACGQAPESAAAAPVVQVADKHEITAQQVKRDVVGRVIKISDVAGKGPPDEWTFEAGEYKQAEILESQRSGNDLTVVVHMMTRNIPKADESSVQVSGRLRLRYALKNGKWVLNAIDNLTFRYSIGVAT